MAYGDDWAAGLSEAAYQRQYGEPERTPPRDAPEPERSPPTDAPTIPPQEVRLDVVGRGPAAPPVLPRQSALSALQLVSPDAYEKAMGLYADQGTRLKALGEKESAAIAESQARRAPLEAGAKASLGEYETALTEPRPTAPTLAKLPAPPDLTPRPWLDPEGRDALRTITQGLGALAVGVAGLAVGAPKTMLAYYREALQDWQKDEHERGNAKWRQFQGELTRVQGDNADALKVYDLAERQYGANLEAKRAAFLSHLDALGMENETLRAATLPIDAQRRAMMQERETIGGMVTAAQHLDSIRLKQAELVEKFGKSPAAAVTNLDKAIVALAEEQAKPDADPVKVRMLQKIVTDMKGYRLNLAQARADQGVAAKEVGLLDKKLLQTDEMEQGLAGLLRDYQTLQKAGLLPDKPTMVSGWIAGAQRQFGANWTPEAQEAANRIQHFYPQKIVAFERSQGDIGARVKAAYGPLENTFVPYSQAKGIIRGMLDQLDALRGLYREQRGRLATGVAAPAGAAPAEEAEE